ncbi:MAG: trypsin-like peptidase domain-containing protein [Myxococcaceae bacterium]
MHRQWGCALPLLLAWLALPAADAATPPPSGTTPPAPGPKLPPVAAPAVTPSPPPVSGASYCPGEYADDFSALLPKARELEQQVGAYTFCIRTSATYECPSYGPDGNLRRKKVHVSAHGTGFAYRQQAGETLLLTNQHVAEWPAVTDEEHPVDDVPVGCKRVADSLKIVDDTTDTYEADDLPLSRVVVDPMLDIAVLKAKTLLPVLPWKLGRSAGLKERNVVDVRGFPLGVFKATNVGKVTSAYARDSYKDWDHDDFVIDALLSPGNSGSPVFAISCKTGEFELVGVYHAGYTRGSALNVVIGIDQVRDLMTTLKRSARAHSDVSLTLDGAARARLVAATKQALDAYFPLGPMAAAVHVREDGALVFEVLNRDFPFRAYPAVVLEDLPPTEAQSFGLPGRVWFGNRQGLKAYARADLDADTQSQLAKLLEGLRGDSVASVALHAADHDAASSREKHEGTERLEKALQRASASYADVAQAAVELADRLGPAQGEPSVDFTATLVPPAVQPPAPLAASPPPPAAVPPSTPGAPRPPPAGQLNQLPQ